MLRPKTMTYAAGLAAALALGGCAAGGGTGTTPSAPLVAETTSTTSEAVTSSSAAPTSAEPKFPPGLPDAAKKHTKAGAEAFVRYYIDRWNFAWTEPDPDGLRPLCDATSSKACAAQIRDAEEYLAKGWRYKESPVGVDLITPLAPDGERLRVLFQGTQNAASVVDRSGDQREAYSFKQVKAMFFVRWSPTGWRVVDLRPL